ncbi:MAG: cysteine desulfurase NifS, partial [Myxococcales bacterium]|nr:cysteine desulfurase NifS [Myxococcales bacterium]
MIYLDNAASTPLDPEIAAGITSRWAYAFANPSSSHVAGRTARKLLDESRERLASAIGGKG